MGYNKNKFNFSEIFNNSDGKTSGSAFVGIVGSLISLVCLLIAMIGYIIGLPSTTEILTSLTLIIGIFTGLLVTRKIVGGKPQPEEENKG